MIKRDRELLARLANVNARLGEATLELLEHQDGGELPAEGMRALGGNLAELGADLLARAAELEGKPPIDCLVIDAVA